MFFGLRSHNFKIKQFLIMKTFYNLEEMLPSKNVKKPMKSHNDLNFKNQLILRDRSWENRQK